MAVVFRARDDQLGRLVALKIMAPSVASDAEFRQRFVRESRAAAAVDDPHIIPVFEAGESAGVLFIAMRYVAGGDVRSLLAREGPLSVDQTSAILVSVASALDAAHAAGLVHRDVKPGNMLMDVRKGRPDHVYLADFGLTKPTSGAVTLTSTGRFLGTADYAAPEQIGGRRLDGRADQYALACAAVEMLTGQTPFPLENAMAVLIAHRSEPPPPLSARRHGLPAELDAVLGRALAKSPSDRYRSCGDFAAAFQARSRRRPVRGSRHGRSIAPQNRRRGSHPRPRRTRRCSRGTRRHQALGAAALDGAARPDRCRPGPPGARRALGDRRSSGCCRCRGRRRVPHARAAQPRTWRTCRWHRSHGGGRSVCAPLAHLRRPQRVCYRSAAWLGRRLEDARRGSVHWDARRVCRGGRVEHAPAGRCPG